MAGREYALAALDMDGTLLNRRHETSEYTRAVLRHAAEAGKVIALCTGRCLSEIRAHLRANPGIGYVIAENGGCLYDVRAGRILRQAVIDEAEARRILALTDGVDVCRQGFIGGQSYMECLDETRLARYHVAEFAGVFQSGSIPVDDLRDYWKEHGGALEKINLYFAREWDREAFAAQMKGRAVNLSPSLGSGFEITPPGASKALGLQALCAYLGIPVEDAMAVGDGGNDLELMGAAGLSVAMGNAIEPVKAAADEMTDDNDRDGAAHAVVRFMLGGIGPDMT